MQYIEKRSEMLNVLKPNNPIIETYIRDYEKEVLKESALSTKDKTLLLVAICAARRDEQSMLYYTEQAVIAGNGVVEIAELISSAIISRGIPTWLSGIEAITHAISIISDEELKLQRNTGQKLDIATFQTQEECIHYYQTEFSVLPKWVQYLIDYQPDMLLKYSNLRITSLRDGEVSRLLKELLLYAINVSDNYSKGMEIHRTNALNLGATQEVLFEVHILCTLLIGFKAIQNLQK
ncbi:carboxymuconolactone decarboxylase family protein [Rummeliibacillus sp. JY-2-4R]